jgi:hypothetical protein
MISETSSRTNRQRIDTMVQTSAGKLGVDRIED